MNELMNLLNHFERRIFDDWIKDIPNKINTNMNRYLLNRLSNNLIEINFHNELVCLLREAHLLKSYKIDNLPKQLSEFFDLKENLWVSKFCYSFSIFILFFHFLILNLIESSSYAISYC